ncbi:hypothetical protein D7042_07625 [Klebsiella pneumoniae]|nr:hypothetical protein EAO16_10825 [Klebsiella pneumoniae]TXA53964.1 hypothetical protein D7039_06810 [Klebsiella pneumoniae]TXA55099.1 hypothetical protein D7038_04850 [Klebsiella pneumoniae]TXA61845.1 hypothetical protein D7041_01845 [Klebsiella pneumoniae]TXA67915.1 hypothetical protein D7034_03950 [Klebsiella pneumoniae]
MPGGGCALPGLQPQLTAGVGAAETAVAGRSPGVQGAAATGRPLCAPCAIRDITQKTYRERHRPEITQNNRFSGAKPLQTDNRIKLSSPDGQSARASGRSGSVPVVVPDGGINALSGLQDHTTQAHTAPCANAALMWLTPALPWPPSPRASRDEAAHAAGSPRRWPCQSRPA